MKSTVKVRAAAAALSAALAISLEAALPVKVPAGSVLAGYTDIGACGRNAALTAYMTELKAAFSGSELVKPWVDWASDNGYLDYSLYGEGWMVFSVGPLTRPPDDAETFPLPDIALAMYAEKRNPLNLAPIVKLWNERAPEEARTELAAEVSVQRKSIAGAEVRELVFRDSTPTDTFPNFKICWTRLFDDRLFIAALSEEALARQILLLRDGVGEADPSFGSLFAPNPSATAKLLVPHLGRTIASLVHDDELALLGALPDETPIADIIKGLGDLSYESIFEGTVNRNVFSIEFADAETAQKLNGMLLAVLVPMRQVADTLDPSDPEQAFAASVLKSFKSKVVGTTLNISMEASWSDAVAHVATIVPFLDELIVSVEEDDEDDEDDGEDAPDAESDAEVPAAEPVVEQPAAEPVVEQPVAEPVVEQPAAEPAAEVPAQPAPAVQEEF